MAVVTPPPVTNLRTVGTSGPPNGISPPYLLGPTGSKYLYSMAIIYDGLTDAGAYALRARFPHYAPSDAFQWLQTDRQVDQGYSESNAGFADRLPQWLDLWAHAGASTGILLSLRGAVAPALPTVRTVQESGTTASFLNSYNTWDTYCVGINPFPPGTTGPTPPVHQVTKGSTGTWTWDSQSTPFYSAWMWWRKWPIILSPGSSPYAVPTATWGPASGTASIVVQNNATYGTVYAQTGPASNQGAANFRYGSAGVGTCWGWAGTNAQAKALTANVRKWKSAHVWVPHVLVAYSASWFDPASTYPAATLPNGQWGYWGQMQSSSTYGTVYVRARPSESQVSFIDGTRRDMNTSY